MDDMTRRRHDRDVLMAPRALAPCTAALALMVTVPAVSIVAFAKWTQVNGTHRRPPDPPN